MDGFVGFMRSTTGRLLRIILGGVLVYWGFWGGAGTLVGVIGFIPILAGVINFCLFAPLFGRTIWGKPRNPAA